MPGRSFLLTTVGSTGDVVPLLALARALLARGDRVRLATHPFHRALVEGAGVELVPVGPVTAVAAFNRLVEDAARARDPLAQYAVLVRGLFMPEPERQLAELEAAAGDVDAVVAQRFDLLGQEAALRRGRPWATVTLAPQLLRTREAPVPPAPALGRWWADFTWDALEGLARPLNLEVATVLGAIGARPRPLGIAGASSPHLDLVPSSRVLSPPRGDWPAATVMTGPWFLDASAPLEPALARFLDAHPRPVVVTFGSMGGEGAAAKARALVEGLARAGRPAVVQRGYAGLLEGEAAALAAAYPGLRDRLLLIGPAPHDLLFPRAACVVHHAGAGTAHAALRAGVPSLPVPHLFDQHQWAALLHRAGVAARPVDARRLDARALARGIEAATARKVTARAAALGATVRAEDGLGRALAALDALVEGRPR